MLRSDPALFQNPPETAKTLEGVFKEIAPLFTITKPITKQESIELDAEKGWEIDAAYKNDDDVIVHQPAWVMQKNKSVWINVSELKEGTQGSRFYAAIADYAFNNGLVFIGDPAGLSDIAVYRRTENMLASAIKHGTTQHLWPHEKQDVKWTGDDETDFQALIEKSISNILGHVPDLKAIRYDFNRREFVGRSGEAFTEAMFETLAESPGAREAKAGRSTLKRTAYLHTLSSRSGEGTGESRRLLEDVVRQLRQRIEDSQLKGLFYSRT